MNVFCVGNEKLLGRLYYESLGKNPCEGFKPSQGL